MKEKKNPIVPGFSHILHGGDYNPEQWIETPEIWQEDMRLMKLANFNTMSIGIFSWAMLEPEEGVYDFSVLDKAMDNIYRNGGKAVLATPSGARPHWMSDKYPEVLRVLPDRRRALFGVRHNHCFTSPVYREKTAKINRLLAQRYKDHPALGMWHVSNEYGGECHCPLCQAAFREWLKKKYQGDLERLNHAWWTAFWSHRYTSWEQIESPSPIGEQYVHGQNLDWMRFVTDQTADFMRNETAPLREITSHIPVTTNFMGFYPGLNYWKLREEVDVISWDNYPDWHAPHNTTAVAVQTAFLHDMNRSFLQKPFMMMESTPSHVNWRSYNKLKRPGMHKLSSIQAVAHGSDTVQYFQWRKSRGSSEKLHGAVVDHCGHEHTRVFREVAELGALLQKLDGVVGTMPESKVAVLYDWENRWALDDLQGLQKENKKYVETVLKHYTPFWKRGVSVDVLNFHQDLSPYALVVAPMMYMMERENILRLKQYVAAGGTLVGTYLTGEANENDLCWLGGFPAEELKDVFGLWAEEIDTLYPEERNAIVLPDGTEYGVCDYCEVIHPSGAEVLATYKEDFYAGLPAVCKNSYGKGTAYYIACRDTGAYTDTLYASLLQQLQIPCALQHLPEGVTAHRREGSGERYLFVENYNSVPVSVELDKNYFDIEAERTVNGTLQLDGYGVKVLKEI